MMIVAAILSGTLTAYLFFRSVRSAGKATHLFRMAAIAVPVIFALICFQPAIAVSRVLYALWASVWICEMVLLFAGERLGKKAAVRLHFLPVAAPLLAFYPYASMAGYFFGLDRGLLYFTAFAVLLYALPGRYREGTSAKYLDGLLLISSLFLLFWSINSSI